MWTKKDVNRYWNDRSVMYFEHAKKPYQLSEDYGLKKEWIFYIMCKEMHNFYDDVDKWYKYYYYRKRYETPEWWRKKYDKSLTRFPIDIRNIILDFTI